MEPVLRMLVSLAVLTAVFLALQRRWPAVRGQRIRRDGWETVHHSGTEVDWLSAKACPRKLGVYGETLPSSFVGLLVYPFRRQTVSPLAQG